MKAIIKFDIKVPIKIFSEDDGYVSYCPNFDVSSQGNTPEEARTNLIDALTGFITMCYEMGTLSEILKECGFVPDKLKNNTNNISEDNNEDFIDIPLPFISTKKELATCHV